MNAQINSLQRLGGVSWGWLLFAGIVSVVAGLIGLGVPWVVTLVSILIFGWLLVIGGVFELFAAFNVHRTGIKWLLLLGGIFNIVVGVLLVIRPMSSTLVVTLLMATFFFVGGLFRAIGAIIDRFHNWGWAVFSGLISIVFGLMIWLSWPSSSLWVIGTLVSIELLFRGWAWIMFALAVRGRKS